MNPLCLKKEFIIIQDKKGIRIRIGLGTGRETETETGKVINGKEKKIAERKILLLTFASASFKINNLCLCPRQTSRG